MSNGIAHISFSGGGVFLPARSPYDRQTLMEYVAHHLGAGRQVQVLVDDQRWLVRLKRRRPAGCCSQCATALESVSCSAANGEAAYCMKCALGGNAEPMSAQPALHGRAG
ncbi:MAG: hypothetical protein ACHQ9S_20045 [Candidatus Binatia bacterium]